MLRATLFFFALAVAAVAQNPLLTSSNTRLKTDTYGGGVSSLSGLPVGTADGTSSGQLALKTINVGTGTVILSGSSLTPTFATLTTSGTIAAGYHTIDLLFTSNFVGTLVSSGTLTVSGSTLTAYSFPPVGGTTMPAISYTISSGTMQMSAR